MIHIHWTEVRVCFRPDSYALQRTNLDTTKEWNFVFNVNLDFNLSEVVLDFME